VRFSQLVQKKLPEGGRHGDGDEQDAIFLGFTKK